MIGVIILASGFSKRMGHPKLLLRWNNKTILRRVVETAIQTEDTRVKVVVNPFIPELKQEINDLPVEVVVNPHANTGISASIRLGIKLMEDDIKGAMILLGDQPMMTKQIIDQVLMEYRKASCRIVQASFQGIPSHPVIFDRILFPELMTITGDRGAKSIIEKYRSDSRIVHLDLPPIKDIDTKEDYAQLLKSKN